MFGRHRKLLTVSQTQYVGVVQNLLVRNISLYSNCASQRPSAPPELVLALIFGKTTLLLGQLDGCKSSFIAPFHNVPRVSGEFHGENITTIKIVLFHWLVYVGPQNVPVRHLLCVERWPSCQYKPRGNLLYPVKKCKYRVNVRVYLAIFSTAKCDSVSHFQKGHFILGIRKSRFPESLDAIITLPTSFYLLPAPPWHSHNPVQGFPRGFGRWCLAFDDRFQYEWPSSVKLSRRIRVSYLLLFGVVSSPPPPPLPQPYEVLPSFGASACQQLIIEHFIRVISECEEEP